MSSSFQALIFDFNGTLLWDTPLHNLAWDRYLKRHAISISDAEKNRLLHGKTNNEIFRLLLQRPLDPEELAACSEEKESIYRELCLDRKIQLAHGATELFAWCRGHTIPMAIATSSYRPNVDFFIEQFDLLQWFERDLIIYNDGNIRSKPDPQIFLIASEKLAVRPADLIIFEDSLAGIQSAEAAGAGKIIVVNSNRDSDLTSPHLIIDSLIDFDCEHWLRN